LIPNQVKIKDFKIDIPNLSALSSA